jgi:cyclophilin family peptidyl-prolyl cis-trans isomerase
MYKVVAVLMIGFIAGACQRESGNSVLLTDDYPELYTHVFDRNADSLYNFIDHPKSHVKQQAWRALISTPVEDVDELLTKVQYANRYEGWMALSTHELTEEQLNRLHTLWERRVKLRTGISLVLGYQGNQESLDFLVGNFENFIDQPYEFETALAISRLMMEYDISTNTRKSLLKYAAIINEVDLFRAYFYGLYRGRMALQDEEMKSILWDTYNWTEHPEIKQYVIRILFNSDAEGTLNRLSLDDVSKMNVQLAVELVQNTALLPWSEKLEAIYEQLLEHANPVVNETTLNQLQIHPEKPSVFDVVILEQIVTNEEKVATVRLSGIMTLSESGDYLDLAEKLSTDNEYTFPKKLKIYGKNLETGEYLNMLEPIIEAENRRRSLFVAQALGEWWNNLENSQITPQNKRKVRELVFDLLDKGDRSITYITAAFLQNSELISAEDYPKLEQNLSKYRLPADVEVYQVFGSLFKAHFEKEAQALIDSIAQKGNAALNNTLQQQGWEVPDVEDTGQTFRKPDWERLAELEYAPVWVLETEKGTIKITMDVLSAPATISGIDSLSWAGAYNDVAFHRVVPNFVIQGGDVESGDGFGGPDYVVPTEASSKQYKRGMVGIASAGTDTEGSQYFVMHDWAPHLNGRYTIIGEVTEGMDVVDNILVGDKVLKTYWQK